MDPTPGGLDNLANRDRLLLVTKMRELVDYMQVLWDDYVLGLNSTRQQQAIYGPLVRSLRAIVRAVLSRAAWREGWQNWRVSLGQGLVLLTLALMLYLFRKPLRRWLSQLLSLWPRRSGRRGNHVPRVDFYERLLHILARRGYRRPPQQTPLEFAAATGVQLAEIAPTAPVAGIPRRITDAFYRVRFGGQSLSAEERTQLKLVLADLDQACGKPIPKRGLARADGMCTGLTPMAGCLSPFGSAHAMMHTPPGIAAGSGRQWRKTFDDRP